MNANHARLCPSPEWAEHIQNEITVDWSVKFVAAKAAPPDTSDASGGA
jgi:hypothetical protein